MPGWRGHRGAPQLVQWVRLFGLLVPHREQVHVLGMGW